LEKAILDVVFDRHSRRKPQEVLNEGYVRIMSKMASLEICLKIVRYNNQHFIDSLRPSLLPSSFILDL
jgi:hypothetical protein